MSSFSSQRWTPEMINTSKHILDMEKYNGRINLMDLSDHNTRFKMFEKIAIKNKSTEYRYPVTGILEDNMLEKVYFSSGNIQIIQNGLRAGVYDMSKDKKIVLPPQNIDNLKIISCKKFKANLLLLVINFILLIFIRIIVIIKNINFQFLVKFKKGMKTSYLISITNFLHVNAISYEKSVLSAFIIFHLKIHH